MLPFFEGDNEYVVMSLEYGLTGSPPCRIRALGPLSPTPEAAEDLAREEWGTLSFREPPEPLSAGGNLGNIAYKLKWRVVVVYGTETKNVVSMADLP